MDHAIPKNDKGHGQKTVPLCSCFQQTCWLGTSWLVQASGSPAGLPAAVATATAATTAAAAVATTATAAATEAAAATAAAATEAATATAAAEATAATAAATILAGTGFVDGEVTTIDVATVHALDGGASVVIAGELDEAEAAGAAGFAIHDEGRGRDLAELGEHFAELGLRGAERQISDVKLHS